MIQGAFKKQQAVRSPQEIQVPASWQPFPYSVDVAVEGQRVAVDVPCYISYAESRDETPRAVVGATLGFKGKVHNDTVRGLVQSEQNITTALIELPDPGRGDVPMAIYEQIMRDFYFGDGSPLHSLAPPDVRRVPTLHSTAVPLYLFNFATGGREYIEHHRMDFTGPLCESGFFRPANASPYFDPWKRERFLRFAAKKAAHLAHETTLGALYCMVTGTVGKHDPIQPTMGQATQIERGVEERKSVILEFAEKRGFDGYEPVFFVGKKDGAADHRTQTLISLGLGAIALHFASAGHNPLSQNPDVLRDILNLVAQHPLSTLKSAFQNLSSFGNVQAITNISDLNQIPGLSDLNIHPDSLVDFIRKEL